MKKEIKEQIEEVEEMETEEENKRSNLTIQDFFNDMTMLRDQLQNKKLAKPYFQYGTTEVTNYLLWLLLGEAMKLNDKLDEEE